MTSNTPFPISISPELMPVLSACPRRKIDSHSFSVYGFVIKLRERFSRCVNQEIYPKKMVHMPPRSDPGYQLTTMHAHNPVHIAERKWAAAPSGVPHPG